MCGKLEWLQCNKQKSFEKTKIPIDYAPFYYNQTNKYEITFAFSSQYTKNNFETMQRLDAPISVPAAIPIRARPPARVCTDYHIRSAIVVAACHSW